MYITYIAILEYDCLQCLEMAGVAVTILWIRLPYWLIEINETFLDMLLQSAAALWTELVFKQSHCRQWVYISISGVCVTKQRPQWTKRLTFVLALLKNNLKSPWELAAAHTERWLRATASTGHYPFSGSSRTHNMFIYECIDCSDSDVQNHVSPTIDFIV